MSLDRFEFKIDNDIDGSLTELGEMSLSESKALVTLLNSMITIAENSTSTISDFTIKVEKGSAVVAMEAPDLSNVFEEYNDVLSNSSNNPEIVQAYRDVQNLFLKNGLNYSSSFKTANGSYNDLYNEIKGAKTFRTKSIARDKNYKITFLKGYLREVGGTNPNFHIVNDGDVRKIECTHSEARRVKDELYSEIFLSVFETKFSDGKSKYSFIDYYKDENTYSFYKDLIHDGYKIEKLNYLRKINQEIKNNLINGDFINVRRLLKLYNFEIIDNSILKTILIITKSFSDKSEIKDLRLNIKNILEKKRGAALV